MSHPSPRPLTSLFLAFLIPLYASLAARAADPAHVLFLIGEDEYKSEVTMPGIAKELESRFGMKTTLLHDKNMTSVWKPEAGKRLNDMPGLEALKDADLLVVYMRFRTFPEEQVKSLQEYLDSGKPIVAFRTSTHAFNYASGDPLAEHWNAFGARVLGAPWIHHYGHESSTDVSVVPGAEGNPILSGVDPSFHVRSWLYQVRPEYPPKDAEILLIGKSVGPSQKPEAERDLNPVAWTRTHPGGGKVFMTTIGHPEDFEVPAFRRLVFNGIHWALGKPILPESAKEKHGSLQFELQDGDRVALIGENLLDRERYDGYIETLLTLRFPGRGIRFRNYSWAGDTVRIQARPLNFGELETHLEPFQPNVFILAYGMNSAFDQGVEGIPEFLAGYTSILARARAFDPREIALLSPITLEDLGPPLPDQSSRNRILAEYRSAISGLAREQGCRFVDLCDLSPQGSAEREFLTENGIHLNARGYWRAANRVLEQLGLQGPDLRLEVDARRGSATLAGKAIPKVERGPEGVELAVDFPFLPPPMVPPSQVWRKGSDKGREPPGCALLRVEGLEPGKYTVAFNGKAPELTLPSEFLEKGVNLPTPFGAEEQTEQVRRLVVEKNQLFFFRWRAHNGEYIYGRRSKSSGDPDGQGNAGNDQFPAEMDEFERLIAEKEAEISRLAVPEPVRVSLRKKDDPN
ncbi:MAG: hypothetical protein GHCLOJNM_02115 [bacterium]|nr:hypothetical protein [bacterium]